MTVPPNEAAQPATNHHPHLEKPAETVKIELPEGAAPFDASLRREEIDRHRKTPPLQSETAPRIALDEDEGDPVHWSFVTDPEMVVEAEEPTEETRAVEAAHLETEMEDLLERVGGQAHVSDGMKGGGAALCEIGKEDRLAKLDETVRDAETEKVRDAGRAPDAHPEDHRVAILPLRRAEKLEEERKEEAEGLTETQTDA